MGLPEADLFALTENAARTCLPNKKEKTEQPKPNLSQTIDYDTDIAPYQFTKIFSGVGSGKNYFINNLVLGRRFKHHDGTPVRPMCVLLLSPRKAKIQETLNLKDVHYDPWIGMFDSSENDWIHEWETEEYEFRWIQSIHGCFSISTSIMTREHTRSIVLAEASTLKPIDGL